MIPQRRKCHPCGEEQELGQMQRTELRPGAEGGALRPLCTFIFIFPNKNQRGGTAKSYMGHSLVTWFQRTFGFLISCILLIREAVDHDNQRIEDPQRKAVKAEGCVQQLHPQAMAWVRSWAVSWLVSCQLDMS